MVELIERDPHRAREIVTHARVPNHVAVAAMLPSHAQGPARFTCSLGQPRFVSPPSSNAADADARFTRALLSLGAECCCAAVIGSTDHRPRRREDTSCAFFIVTCRLAERYCPSGATHELGARIGVREVRYALIAARQQTSTEVRVAPGADFMHPQRLTQVR
jgi:hypothetical protein